MAYTATDVKTLRERTGAGMMDCKKALDESNGDLEAAVDSLRAKGLAAAAKKSSRTAAEGLVGVAVNGTRGVAVEVNSETDFVAKNEQFQDFVRKTTQVALESEGDKAALEELGKKIAMHVAAAFPQALSAADLDPAVLERERKIALEKAIEEAARNGKQIPEDILAKRADGAAAKFAKDNALLSQVFVMDNKTPIAQVVEQAGKAAGAQIVLKDYVRFQLGEGIEKKVSDFAAEVAEAAGIKAPEPAK